MPTYGVARGIGRQMRHDVTSRGAPGSRKYRRWLNLAALQLAEATMYPEDLEEYADRRERQGRMSRHEDYETNDPFGDRRKIKPVFYEPRPTTFQRLFENEQDYHTWQDFIEVTEELQSKMMKQPKKEIRAKIPQQPPLNNPKKLDDHLSQCFTGVHKRDTNLMINLEFIEELESELDEFIALGNAFRENPAIQEAFNNPELSLNASRNTKDKNVRALEEDISREERREVVYEQLEKMAKARADMGFGGMETKVRSDVKPLALLESRTQVSNPISIRFILSNTFLRLLAHGLCRFYRLEPKNVMIRGPNGADLQLVVVTNPHKARAPPAMCLSGFLKSQPPL
eukprot:TRINITY_DN2871_c0_g1_i1.p1 TRINITY_DN2871_c0_g1~~TRINITY_DN2871_c0_g1_i1.p1  ORF type:complete len:387 (-),score=126.66 TRINITY_DN2871_c0_g1_i1:60-1085(-)